MDDEDYEALAQFAWCLSKGYAVRNRPGRGNGHVFLHRQVMGEPSCQVDHESRDKLDCRRSNLRLARRNERDNAQNQGARETNPTGVRGVHVHRDGFIARVRLNYKQHYLGRFATVEEAAAVVEAFRREHMPFSEDARVAA